MAGQARSIVTPSLKAVLRDQFQLDWDDIHGGAHWERVRENGLKLAALNGADTDVVELFAWFHDARRLDDGFDPQHGDRAAELARTLCGVEFELPPAALDLLRTACRLHSEGLTIGNITVLTCWDADRLDLGRIGVKPAAKRLCTRAAKSPEIIEWAWQRSQASFRAPRVVPRRVQ
jgi:uncharacterized protein